jgi:uroporphyrinogen-III synthase
VRLLVTRPEPDGARTAAALRAHGHEALLAPLMRVEALTDADLGIGPWSALAFTSANAARTIARHPRRAELTGLPAFAVGGRTADAVRAAGFDDVVSADGDSGDLARLITDRLGGKGGTLLYLAGEDRAGDLTPAGVATHLVVIYRAVAVDRFPPPVHDALVAGHLDGVLHFSRRSAETYLDCASAAGLLDIALMPFHFCLSPHVAEPLAIAGAADIRVASRPEEAALLELVGLPEGSN